jgi:hypothetical protein
VRVQAPVTAGEGQLTCTSGGGPLNAREGRFALKYFDVRYFGVRDQRQDETRDVVTIIALMLGPVILAMFELW